MNSHDSFEQDVASQASPSRTTLRDRLKIFSRGTPRLVLIAGVLATATAAATGVRGLVQDDDKGPSASRVDVPAAPRSTYSGDPVSESIAAARAQIANDEASDAYLAGQSYQPGFDVNVQPDRRLGSVQNAQYGNLPQPMAQVAQAPSVGQQPPNSRPVSMPTASDAAKARIAQEDKQFEEELKKAQGERDQYAEQGKKEILTEIERTYGSGSDYLPDKLGTYTKSTYYTAPAGGDVQAGIAGGGVQTALTKAATQKPLIKTGNVLYAVSDAEINTDDGSEVMASIRGGDWDGARLIGKIQRTPNNISLKFNILAPQDDRPTMRINAVAIREEDAKLGIAENIDHHYIQRYAALAVSSLLGGAGRVFQHQGTAVFHPSGMVATSNGDPADRQIIGSAVGELGTSLSQEFRNDVNRPATYSAPAGQGFGVYFLDDVF
ncbi:MAG: hypothetical protein LBE22_03755 [Azoarcus sp.]|jgi:intracellular multiplication protein IcmE|nr:hypothetical protein [Azoarcus sp.]